MWYRKRNCFKSWKKCWKNAYLNQKQLLHTNFPSFCNIVDDAASKRRFNSDDNFCANFNFTVNHVLDTMVDNCMPKYDACIYKNYRVFCLLLLKHEENGAIQVKYLHFYRRQSLFYWPFKEKISYKQYTNNKC